MNFHRRLRKRRSDLGFSMKDVASRIKVPETTYREWEYGRAIQGVGIYKALANALSLSVYELITGERPNKESLLAKIEQLEEQVEAIKKEAMSFL